MKRTENEAKHYQTFEDLEVYQVAREFRKAMYRVAKRLPEEEKFGLASQIRRAAVSLTNNIAEGHGRFHFLEQISLCCRRAVRSKNCWMTSMFAKMKSASDRRNREAQAGRLARINLLVATFASYVPGRPRSLRRCKNLPPNMNLRETN